MGRTMTDHTPLADRLRPRHLEEMVGQAHLLGRGRPLREAIEAGRLHSMILWGPPGSGKTTLARLVAQHSSAQFLTLSAVFAGVRDIRQAVERAAEQRRHDGGETILFVDEVHRFNRSQQDAFLPHLEDGTLRLIGATTENPSFELNGALLSRARTYVLRQLGPEAIRVVIDRALADADRGLGGLGLDMAPELREGLASAADGDARTALNLLELAADLAASEGGGRIDARLLAEVTGRDARRFDKGGDIFYEQISALHKSIRGSDPDAALYWLARMLDGGCDPLYVARRLVRTASEDIGNADPRGLRLALDACEAYERLGSSEGELAIAQAVAYLASVPKSNAVYSGLQAAMTDVREQGSLEVPVHLRNATTRLMRELGYGEGYRYAHDEPYGYAAGQCYLPPALAGRRYYEPADRGLESRIRERLRWLRRLDEDRQEGSR